MLSSRNFHPALIVGIIWISLVSCSTQRTESLSTVMPATSSVEITLDEKRLPDTCDVFAHLIITIPGGLSASAVKTSVEQYGMTNGANFVLIGMTRESNDSPDSVAFQSYGPKSPYSFKKLWLGWTFGFSDWNSGGALVDYGHDRMKGSEPVFDIPVDAQAVLLSCAPGK